MASRGWALFLVSIRGRGGVSVEVLTGLRVLAARYSVVTQDPCAVLSDACRVAGAGLAPRVRFGALRAERRCAWLLRPFGLRSPTACSAPQVAASGPRHPTRCGVLR